MSLNRDGIGHVALLRDAGVSTAIGRPAGDGPETGPDRWDASVDAAWTLDTDVDSASQRGACGRWPAHRGVADDTVRLAPEDLDLALRYLISFDVLVVAEPLSAATLAVAAESAAFSGAHLVIVGRAAVPPASGDAVTVLEPPAADPDGDFAAVVARYAVALDAGTLPAAAAFRGRAPGDHGLGAGRFRGTACWSGVRAATSRRPRSGRPGRGEEGRFAVSGTMSAGPSLRTLFTSVSTG